MFNAKYIMKKISALVMGIFTALILFVFIPVSYPSIAFAQSPTPPDFRLPLPGGKDWQLSTEAARPTKACGSKGWGGLSNNGRYDCLHAGKGMYSLDLVDYNRQDRDIANVEILAAADGIVLTKVDGRDNCNTPSCTPSYGNYVVIKHGIYTSFYGHLKKNSILVSEGRPISRGDTIGVMGKYRLQLWNPSPL